MKTQLINRTWQPTTVTTSMSVACAYGFAMRDVFSLPSLAAAATTTAKKHHAAAIKANAQGLQPWSPPVT